MPSPLVYFQIATTDLEASRRFFSELLDWDLGDEGTVGIDPQGPADFDVKGAFFPLPAGGAPFVTPWFRVSHLAGTLAKAEALGARVIAPVRRTAGGADVALIRTPEGLAVGIVQA
jgi:predicted enzyme related to lactoylglutathione lyase